jgi:hypothetical protein
MRRINRGLFQVAMSRLALENEEVGTPAETTPATDTVTATAATDNVEVTVKVETDGEATVEKVDASEVPAEVVPATQAPVAEVPATTPETTDAVSMPVTEPTAEERIKALEAEIALLKGGDKPATEDNTVDPAPVVADVAAPVEEAPAAATAETPVETADIAPTETATETAVAEGETAVVKDGDGEVVATVTTTDTGTTVTTAETKVEVVQTEDKIAVEVTVLADETPSISAEDMVVIETDGEQTEVEIQDAVDVAEDAAELAGECDDAEEAAMVLESFAEIAESAAANGGLDTHSARILKVATEHIYAHMGMGKAIGIPAMESFDIPGARVSATTIALEDIREQAKKIWVAIVEGFKKTVAWVQEFVMKILSANARIKARAEKLMAATDKMTGAPKSKVVGNGALVKALTIGGRVPSNLAGEVKKAVDFFFNAMGDRTAETISKALSLTRQAMTSKDAEQVEALVFDAVKSVTGKGLQYNNVASSVAARIGIAEAPTGTSISMTPRFPGEQVVWAYIPSSVASIASFRSGVSIDANAGNVPDDAKVNALTPEQIKDVAKVAMSFVDVSETYKELQKSLDTFTKGAANFMSMASAAGSNNASDTSLFKLVGSSIKAIRHLVKGIHQPAAVVASRVVNASLNLAVESAKQYGVKAA